MNSVDFRLKIGTESGAGWVSKRYIYSALVTNVEFRFRILTRKIGYLYVGGFEPPFAQIRVTKQVKDFHNKIIECKFENNEWVFMRERTDKSFPNSYNTAKGNFDFWLHRFFICRNHFSMQKSFFYAEIIEYESNGVISLQRFVKVLGIQWPPKFLRNTSIDVGTENWCHRHEDYRGISNEFQHFI